MTTTDHKPPEQEPLIAEANIFALNPAGFKVHIKLPSSPRSVVGNINTLLSALADSGYTPDTSMMPRHEPVAAGVASSGMQCGICNSPNVKALGDGDRRSAKSPWFRCNACDAAAWKDAAGKPKDWKASTK